MCWLQFSPGQQTHSVRPQILQQTKTAVHNTTAQFTGPNSYYCKWMDGVRLCERFNSEGRKMTEGQTAAVISLGRIIEHGSADNNEKNTRNTHKLL